ncbi:uncharacterized protein N7482_008974 [Penicillium canariense]|uniref:Uncharacterized protein n=1 Tax=Penicillium canariense TaxID=189055 RepID=A0A9W9LIU9_9EURO|nr:uncharacterized protein N7482_008974 [Penicillium canariense]KAJ5157874.1 hypothetical protein N7482_008974 [Penicillium canariense]
MARRLGAGAGPISANCFQLRLDATVSKQYAGMLSIATLVAFRNGRYTEEMKRANWTGDRHYREAVSARPSESPTAGLQYNSVIRNQG